MIPSELV